MNVLLRSAPPRPETVGNDGFESVGQADVLSTFSLAFHRHGLGLFESLAPWAGVAPNLSAHGRGMYSEEFGDAPHGVAFFAQDVDLNAVVVRELFVDHVCAPAFWL